MPAAMKSLRRLSFLLLAAMLSAGAVSCVETDWDDDYYSESRPRRYYDDRPRYYDDEYEYDRYDDRYAPPPPRGYDRDRRRDDRRYEDRRRDDRRRDDRKRDDPGGAISVKTPKGFVRAGSFTAGGAAKEMGIPTSKPIKKIRIVAISGSVIVNTVVLREGSTTKKYPLAVRIAPGESREIDLGRGRKATGIRISDGGKGTYNVYVH